MNPSGSDVAFAFGPIQTSTLSNLSKIQLNHPLIEKRYVSGCSLVPVKSLKTLGTWRG